MESDPSSGNKRHGRDQGSPASAKKARSGGPNSPRNASEAKDVIPTWHSLKEVYPQSANEAEKRYAAIVAAFVERYGHKPEFFARAPGRVNIIGEHVDYSGYSVLPMAIQQDIIFAVSRVPTDGSSVEVSVANTDPHWERKTMYFDMDEQGVPKVSIDPTKNSWINYFLCGYKGMTEKLRLARPNGLELMAHGTVPPGAGLSSSSALVVASAVATLAGTSDDLSLLSRPDIAAVCAASEKFVGVEGGGMDQAISLLGEAGKAKHVEFNPVRATTVVLPSGASWFVTHSLVESHKQKTAATNYNKRVVECRLATVLLAKALGGFGQVRNMHDLQVQSGRTLEDMIALVKQTLHEEPYGLQELRDLVDLNAALVGLTQGPRVIDEAAKTNGLLYLRQRSLHVFSEALRVCRFQQVCASSLPDQEKLALLGKSMNESHESCALLYHCSCEELDELQKVCIAGGALGSRLTGAGWGGCVISLVPEHLSERFRETVRAQYYSRLAKLPDTESEYLFATRPANGAAIYRPNP